MFEQIMTNIVHVIIYNAWLVRFGEKHNFSSDIKMEHCSANVFCKKLNMFVMY